MLGPPYLITFIRQFLKLPDNLWKVLHTDISDGTPLIFVFLWPWFDLETQRGNQPLYWFSYIIFFLWRFNSRLVRTAKLQLYFQGGVLITTLDLSVFPNFFLTTNFHVHSCELTKCEIFLLREIFLLELLPSGTTMINRQWCYNC